MPYRHYENGNEYLISRTTEISNSYECEMYAKLNQEIKNKMRKNKEEKIIVRGNVAALRGTIVHHRIESFLSETIDKSKPSFSFDLSQQKLYKKIRANKERYQFFINSINNSYDNFTRFYIDHKEKFIPLFLEKKIVIINRKEDGTIDEKRSVAGTIDCIAKWKTPKGWRTVIVDWKTSKQSLLSHFIQLSGYYWELTNHPFYKEMAKMGILEKYPYWFEEGKPVALCGIFGGRNYELKKYKVDINKWLKAWEIHNNPRSLSYNHGSREIGVKGLCIVCDRVNYCPEFSFHDASFNDLPSIKKD